MTNPPPTNQPTYLPTYLPTYHTQVTVMNKNTGKMALLYASSKETKRKLTAEKGGTSYFEEELRPAALSADAAGGIGAQGPMSSDLSYMAASGMAISKVGR